MEFSPRLRLTRRPNPTKAVSSNLVRWLKDRSLHSQTNKRHECHWYTLIWGSAWTWQKIKIEHIFWRQGSSESTRLCIDWMMEAKFRRSARIRRNERISATEQHHLQFLQLLAELPGVWSDDAHSVLVETQHTQHAQAIKPTFVDLC